MTRFWWTLIVVLGVMSVLMRHNLLFLMTLFLGLMGGASLLWANMCLKEVTYRRRFGAARVFQGDEVELTIEIANAKLLPLAWLRAEDEYPVALELPTTHTTSSHRPGWHRLVNLLSLRWYERVTRRYKARAVRRGVWHMGPVRVSSGDIFGFAIQRESHEEMETIIVYPKVVPVTTLGLPANRPFGELTAMRRLSEDPLRLMGAREYAPGDSYRHIHWKTTARRQALHTKVFEPSAAQPIAIFVNVNTFDLLLEGQDYELQEFAISAAASIAHWAWEQRRPVGLYANSITQPGARRVALRPGSKPDRLTHILEALARVVTPGRWHIADVLRAESGRLPYGTTVVVVSATDSDRLRRVLLDLRDRGYGVAFVGLGERAGRKPMAGVASYSIEDREGWRESAGLALV